jgi:putative ABC transport system permease protein
VDDHYSDVFQLSLTEGRFFSSLGTDQNRIVINERLAALIGFKDPVGQILRRDSVEYEIIGVVEDFNFQHLTSEIGPLMFRYTGRKGRLFVKIRSEEDGTVALIQKQISSLSDNSVNINFVVEEYDLLYAGEQQILSGILIFTLLSILLSSLGLIGLVAHGTETKTREIAVRKVFGANTREMMITLNKSLLKVFLPSVFIGSLIAWLVMRGWLMNYSYRRGFEGWVFLLGALLILIVALISVSVQTWKAAKLPPASALKNL